MKLLSLAYIKDAARSVKRICEEMFTEAPDSVLTELLGIAALKVNMYCVRSEGEEEVLHLRCSHRDDIAACSRFGTASEGVHEEKERCVRHLISGEKKTFLHFYPAVSCVNSVGNRSRNHCSLLRNSEDILRHLNDIFMSDARRAVEKKSP